MGKGCQVLEQRQGGKYTVPFSRDIERSNLQAPLGLGRCHVTVLTDGLVGVTSGLRQVRTHMHVPPPGLPSPVSRDHMSRGQSHRV